MAKIPVRFSGPLQANIHNLDSKLNGRMIAIMNYQKQRSIKDMKLNAPWTDRTSNARNGLNGEVVVVPKKSWALVLYHQVPYGIWLELANGKKYAVIIPQIQKASAGLERLLDKLLGVN